jgi:hypothetical protein
VSPVKYEQGFYIPEDGILHSHRRENVKSYKRRMISFSVPSERAKWLISVQSATHPAESPSLCPVTMRKRRSDRSSLSVDTHECPIISRVPRGWHRRRVRAFPTASHSPVLSHSALCQRYGLSRAVAMVTRMHRSNFLVLAWQRVACPGAVRHVIIPSHFSP